MDVRYRFFQLHCMFEIFHNNMLGKNHHATDGLTSKFISYPFFCTDKYPKCQLTTKWKNCGISTQWITTASVKKE